MVQLALPDIKYPPAERLKRLLASLITFGVFRQLLPPEIHIAFRHPSKFAIGVLVAMPETSIDKNNGLILPEDDVRFSRQSRAVETEA